MGTAEDRYNDYRRDAFEDKVERDRSEFPPPPDCRCGGTWEIAERTVYGDDADGNRGAPLIAWDCSNCGDEREVVYA